MSTGGHGRGLRSMNLNANANEYQPSAALMSKLSLQENGDRNCDLQESLRTCILAIVADDTVFSPRVTQIMNYLDHQQSDETAFQVISTIITMAEEDMTRVDAIARITQSFTARFTQVANNLEHRIMHRANYWRSADTVNTQTLGFTHYVAALYGILQPRQQILGCVLCILFNSLISAGGSLAIEALNLVELNIPPLVEDWKQQGEKADSEFEHLMSLVRNLLVRWAGGIDCLTPQAANAALSALERRAGELARLKVFEQLELSRQVSEETDDVYDDYERFLLETGQN